VQAEQSASWRDDLPVLWRMLRGKPRLASAADSLDAFYRPQAQAYDRFRERLLAGRRDLMQALPLTPGARVLDIGAGTGGHWSYVADKVPVLGRLELVDLCQPLLDIARDRFRDQPSVTITQCDAEQFASDQRFDVVLFSYSLSMMPGWRRALETARRHLAPGGLTAVIDFYTLPAVAPQGAAALSRWNRQFWPKWFRHDGVFLDPDVLATLMRSAKTEQLRQELSRIPYLGGLRAPWFIWMGR
jgi:S-adenosylmethionine-diacylgycerolhomoserine-N-methlytransferase